GTGRLGVVRPPTGRHGPAVPRPAPWARSGPTAGSGAVDRRRRGRAGGDRRPGGEPGVLPGRLPGTVRVADRGRQLGLVGVRHRRTGPEAGADAGADPGNRGARRRAARHRGVGRGPARPPRPLTRPTPTPALSRTHVVITALVRDRAGECAH